MGARGMGRGVECMHVILNCESFEEVDCYNGQGSQMAADGGCKRDVVHEMNEGNRA